MDVEILSRVQFAFTIAFHYIYPQLSIGLGVCLVIMSGLWLKTKNPVFHNMARFWTKVFGLTFAIGVATGIVMEFEFGTNWATYSRFVGDVFGSPLAIEGLYAFFLESGFLAVLLFGWDRVGPYMHFFATCMVCLGAHFSAVWIVVANSWMQTPAGYQLVRRVKETEDGVQHDYNTQLEAGTFAVKEIPIPENYVLQAADIENVRAIITDFWGMVFNPSSIDRLTHTLIGCWLAGAFLVVSVSAFYLLRGRHEVFAKNSLRVGLGVACVAIVMQMASAHETAVGVVKNQPEKLAAMEGLNETTEGAGLGVVGWVNWERNDDGEIIGVETHAIKIPGMLSILASEEYFDLFEAYQYPVTGLQDTPSDEFLMARYPDATPEELKTIRPEYWPNVPVLFQTYHLMVALGVMMLFYCVIGAWLWRTGRLWKTQNKFTRMFLLVSVFMVFAPQIANQAGWFTAEMGRQPWVVYHILKTSEGLSQVVTANAVLGSLIMFAFVYSLLFFVFIYTLNRKIKHGPDDRLELDVLPKKWRSKVVETSE